MRRLIVTALLAGGLIVGLQAASITLLTDATATGNGGAIAMNGSQHTFQASGETSAGTGTATIVIEVSNVGAPTVDGDWIVAGTITLTLSTTRSTDGFALDAAWSYVRARVSAISGTDATVSVRMGG